jgi:hypothetical protein
VAANYMIIDEKSQLVAPAMGPAFTYIRVFYAIQDPRASPYIQMDVKTAYNSPLSNASVRINGVKIGEIGPRPWVTGLYIPLETIHFVFSPSVLTPWVPGTSLGPNILDIVTKAGPYDYVFVANVIYHWQN